MRWLIFLVIYGNVNGVIADFQFGGRLQLDTTWRPIVYLSLIPSFEEMYTVSPDMIVASAQIDTNGYFRLDGDHLPAADHLYRLHVSKKGDPPATIIIGGQEENFLFLILNNSSICAVDDSTSIYPRDLRSNLACYPNDQLAGIEDMIRYVDQAEFSQYDVGKELLLQTLDEKLRVWADTTQHHLVALYALYHTPWEKHMLTHPDFYHNFIRKQEKESAYVRAFAQQIPRQRAKLSDWIIGLILAGVGVGIGWWLRGKIARRAVNTSAYYQLSLQERKIFGLVQKGLSNQEIADQLHIQLSTVKSHIRNIYGKLELSSRKEALNYPIPTTVNSTQQ